MPELIRHRTENGYRYGVITGRRGKRLRIHYVAHATPTWVPVTEERHFEVWGDMTPKQVRRFNQSVRRAGGKRGTLK